MNVPATKPDHLSPGAKQVVQPGMTPCQQSQALNQKQMSPDAVKAMAHGLPEHKAVQWASASAEKVSNPAHKTDLAAIQAAKAWSQNPTPENQKAAALAASKTDHQTPGAWAAQGAAWGGSGKGLTAHAVTGAVLLAAAQGGKPIAAPSASASQSPSVPGASAPKMETPKTPEIAQPKAPHFKMPFFKKPAEPATKEPTVGPDGLSMTPAQRAEMSKNCEPLLKLGCDIGQSRA